MADLDAFLASHAGLSWSWGSVDCCMVLADWAIENGHADPAAAWRGAYADELAWKRIVVRRGGLLPLVSDVCDRAGLLPALEAVRGVLGVVGSAHNIDRQWGAIFDGAAWQVRTPDGFVAMSAPVLGMWEV